MNDWGSNYLAIDLGASSGRAILGWLVDGRLAMTEVHRFQTPVIELHGHLFWDVDRLWLEIQSGFQTALDAPGTLRSVSVDSWGVDYVPLDGSGDLVRLPYCYRDSRTTGMMERATERVMPEVIYEATGIQFMEINTLYQVLADYTFEPELQDRTRSRLLIGDYFNYRFSGEAVAERSLASTTQLMRAGTNDWAADLMQDLQIDIDAWPQIVEACTPLGFVRHAEAVTAIAGCSHDTACAVAAVPALADEQDWAYLSCGTWSLLGVELSKPILAPAAREAGFTNEAGLDGTTRFLKNMTGLWILQECERIWNEAGSEVRLADLVEEAEQADAPAGLLDVRDARFAQRGDMPECIRTYCAANEISTPQSQAGIVRLVLESLAEGHRRTLRELESVLGRRIRTLYMVGGGSQSALLCQATANRCGCRVVAGPAEATAIGNLLIQARTMGDLDADIREVVRRSVTLHEYLPEARRDGV